MKERSNRPEWKVVKQFKDDANRLVVTISSTQSTFHPKYSVQVGHLRSDGSASPHIPMNAEPGFKVSFKASLVRDALPLLEQAESWISEEMALRFDESIDKRIEKETRDASFGQNKTRVTGKTAKKKARMKGASA